MRKYYNQINKMKFKSSKTVFCYEKIHEKIVRTFFIDVQNVRHVLLDTYFFPNSIKIDN